ncbi:MAG: fibronectin type III domain-containing protein, partial [Candidatus Thermoplasmatota archaeon]
MERKIISAFIVGALILTVIPQTISIYGYIADERYGTFSWLNPYPTGNLLKCLDWHSKDAYIVCENGEFLKWNKYSFETIEIGTDKDLNCIDWNDENAIIVGEGGLVIIYDGIGAKTINSGTNVDLYGVSWKNNDEAIIVGELGTILEYKNGNINTVSAGGSAIYYSVDSAFDNKTSLIVGESGGKGIIVRYDENGLNYIGNYGSELFDVKWKEDSYYALIVGGSGYGWEILSYDGQINIIEENETYRALRSVTWNKEYAIAVGDRGTFLKIDGNKTEEFYTGENNLFGIEWNIELNYSIAVGSGGTVFTFDGKNAVKLSSNALNEYTSLVSLDWKPNREYALGLGRGGWVTIGNWEVSTIVKYDGTKFQVSYYYGAYLYDIAWKKDGKYALAVGSGGTILKINWDKDLEITYIATNSLNNFRAVAWNIYDRALIVGENGAMRIVTDTLTYPVVSGTIKNLYDVSWADEGSYALAVGEDGVVLRYNGITSTKIFDVDENLYGISSFSSALPCIIVGEKGGIRVYDGHILHSPLQKLTNADLYSVAWEPNGKYALAMGSGGACVRIENNSFYTSLLVTGTNNYLNCIKFTKNYALIFGSLGTVLKYLPNQVPKAVTLSSPTDITDSSLKLSWSKNLDKDFYKYVVYWNTTMDFTYGWAAEIDSRDTNELTIKALNKDTVYYFMVRVYDTGLLYADSNTVWAKTLLGNIPPKAVTLFSPTSISNSSLTLQWSKNNDTDFDKYEVHMSLEKDFVISKDTLINEIKEQNITSYILKGLKDNTTYYFKIRVFDTGGLYNDSNEVSAKTLITNYPPNAVFLYPPKALSSNRILLSWSINNDSDFYSYQIHIANIANFIIENSTLLIEIKNISQNNYIADNLKANTTYYFKIRVYDIGGLYNDSNEDFAKTLPPNDPPIAVILYPPTDITDCSMNLSWSENKDEDFLRYEVHSSLVQNFNITADTILRTFVERNITYTIVTALEPNTTYYFKVRVVDKGGLDNISNEVYGKTILGYPPKAVELYEPKDIKENEVTLIWSENNDSDFEKYEVHSSVEKNFTPTPETFKIGISIRSITNQRLTGLNPNTTYYFKIRVLDKTLLYNDSNEVNATTLGPNLPPKSVTLITKNITKHSIMVEWSRNIDNDFLKYEIHMSMDKNFSITQLTLVANITAQDITDYDIKNLTKNTTYYFKIRVYDNSNLFNDSNEVDAKTLENL